MDETSADQGAVRLVHDDYRDRFAALEGETVEGEAVEGAAPEDADSREERDASAGQVPGVTVADEDPREDGSARGR